MDNELSALFGFLDRFGPEVCGRAIPSPEGELAEKLIRFAKGECEPDERTEVCDLLRKNPAWLRWLADQVKLSRNVAARNSETAL